MLKSFVTCAACLLPLGAFAADLPARTKTAVAPLPVLSWTGFYIGGSVGYASSNVDHTDNKDGGAATAWFYNANGTSYGTDGRSAAAFLNAGYNHQVGQVVIGAEADIGFLNAKGTNIPTTTDPSYLKSSMTSVASARARVGYLFGPALLYATGGVAFAHMSYSGFLDGYAPISKNSWRTGWALGGGLEYALDSKWTVRGEVVYYNFGSTKDIWPDDTRYNLVTKASVVTARVGVNYRF